MSQPVDGKEMQSLNCSYDNSEIPWNTMKL